MSTTKAPKSEKPKSVDKKGKDDRRRKSKSAKAANRPGAKAQSATTGKVKRLRPGELDGLVLAFMREHEDDLPLSPTKIAKGIKRSSGAIGNCLERLAKAKLAKARLAKKAPRAYDLKGVKAR